jgi:hypothetical protein
MGGRAAGARGIDGAARTRLVASTVNHVVALAYAQAQLPAVLDTFTGLARPPPRAGAAARRAAVRDRAPPALCALGAALDVAVALLLGTPGWHAAGRGARLIARPGRSTLWRRRTAPAASRAGQPYHRPRRRTALCGPRRHRLARARRREQRTSAAPVFTTRPKTITTRLFCMCAYMFLCVYACVCVYVGCWEVVQTDPVQAEAVAFYRGLGTRVASVGASVVVASLGHAQLGTRVLSHLTEPCAGQLLTYPEPDFRVSADLLWAALAGVAQDRQRRVRESIRAVSDADACARQTGGWMWAWWCDRHRACTWITSRALRCACSAATVRLLRPPPCARGRADTHTLCVVCVCVYVCSPPPDDGSDGTGQPAAPWYLGGVRLDHDVGRVLALPALRPQDVLGVYVEIDEAAVAPGGAAKALPPTVYIQTEVHYTNRESERYVCDLSLSAGMGPCCC